MAKNDSDIIIQDLGTIEIPVINYPETKPSEVLNCWIVEPKKPEMMNNPKFKVAKPRKTDMMKNPELRIVEPQIPDMMTNSEINIAKPRKP